MNTKANNVKNEIIKKLTSDGFKSSGYVKVISGDSTTNQLYIVIIEITVFNYFTFELQVSKQTTINIHFKSISGIIEVTDINNLSVSLNSTKTSLAQYF